MVTPEPDIDCSAWQNMTRSLAHYERLEQIGEGTYGQVYRARCKDSGRIVAMKKMRIHHGGYWGMPLQLIREIKILKRLHHPRLLSMIEVVTSKGVEHLDTDDPPLKSIGDHLADKASDAREAYKGNLFLVLEYVEHDLTGLLDVAYQFEEVQIKSVFKQLLEALAFMHEHKYVHRDIKSSNILLDSHFRLKLADFGLARCIEPSILEQMQSSGDRSSSSMSSNDLTNKVITLWYRPPEILLGACQYGPAVDVWSAGCILAELLLGKPLFAGKTELETLNLIIDLRGTPNPETWEFFERMKKGKPMSSQSAPPLDLPSIREDNPNTPSRLRDKYNAKVSAPALNLLEKLLEWDPRKRLTAANALQHSYFWKSPPAPDDPTQLGRLEVGPMGHFHEFQTKKKRKEAKAAAEQARSQARTGGATEEEADDEYDKVYLGIMKKVAQEGIPSETQMPAPGQPENAYGGPDQEGKAQVDEVVPSTQDASEEGGDMGGSRGGSRSGSRSRRDWRPDKNSSRSGDSRRREDRRDRDREGRRDRDRGERDGRKERRKSKDDERRDRERYDRTDKEENDDQKTRDEDRKRKDEKDSSSLAGKEEKTESDARREEERNTDRPMEEVNRDDRQTILEDDINLKVKEDYYTNHQVKDNDVEAEQHQPYDRTKNENGNDLERKAEDENDRRISDDRDSHLLNDAKQSRRRDESDMRSRDESDRRSKDESDRGKEEKDRRTREERDFRLKELQLLRKYKDDRRPRDDYDNYRRGKDDSGDHRSRDHRSGERRDYRDRSRRDDRYYRDDDDRRFRRDGDDRGRYRDRDEESLKRRRRDDDVSERSRKRRSVDRHGSDGPESSRDCEPMNNVAANDIRDRPEESSTVGAQPVKVDTEKAVVASGDRSVNDEQGDSDRPGKDGGDRNEEHALKHETASEYGKPDTGDERATVDLQVDDEKGGGSTSSKIRKERLERGSDGRKTSDRRDRSGRAEDRERSSRRDDDRENRRRTRGDRHRSDRDHRRGDRRGDRGGRGDWDVEEEDDRDRYRSSRSRRDEHRRRSRSHDKDDRDWHDSRRPRDGSRPLYHHDDNLHDGPPGAYRGADDYYPRGPPHPYPDEPRGGRPGDPTARNMGPPRGEGRPGRDDGPPPARPYREGDGGPPPSRIHRDGAEDRDRDDRDKRDPLLPPRDGRDGPGRSRPVRDDGFPQGGGFPRGDHRGPPPDDHWGGGRPGDGPGRNAMGPPRDGRPGRDDGPPPPRSGFNTGEQDGPRYRGGGDDSSGRRSPNLYRGPDGRYEYDGNSPRRHGGDRDQHYNNRPPLSSSREDGWRRGRGEGGSGRDGVEGRGDPYTPSRRAPAGSRGDYGRR